MTLDTNGQATGGTFLLDTRKGHSQEKCDSLLQQWPVACEMAIKMAPFIGDS